MRLKCIQDFLRRHHIAYTYQEEVDCGTIDFIHRGLSYHIWEYPEPERGAESNVRTAGRQEEFEGDYETQILSILESWF
ncbi:MAG: kinase [Oscillospiraceae bacterium]|nr:kinase [Oscillospiraceae bacterium]